MSGLTSTDQVFIQKISGIIHANLANENFGVDELAHLSGLSRAAIHKRLQSISNKSTMQFIREVRLQRAMEMLRHESTTAAEVAFKVGFGSPAYFNTCFHEYFGFTPGEVLRNEKREFLQERGSASAGSIMMGTQIPPNENTPKNISQDGRMLTGRHLIIYGFIGLLIVIGLSFLLNIALFRNYPATLAFPQKKDKSISVLPVKDINLDPADQYLTEAMTKDILNKLVQIRELRVAASFPLKEYRENPLNIPLIAKKLGVRYILFVNAQRQDSVVFSLITSGQEQNMTGASISPPKFTAVKRVFPVTTQATPVTIENYMSANIQFPEKAMANLTQGTAVVKYVVSESGTVTDIKIINSVSKEIDNEVIRVLRTTDGMWIPGSFNGEPVPVEREISVAFKNAELGNYTDFIVLGKKRYAKGSELFFMQNNPKKALKYYDEGVVLLPNDKGLLLVRGMARYEIGDFKGACQDWTKIKALGGLESDDYLNNLCDYRGFAQMIEILNK